MKKLIALLMSMALILALFAGCGSSGNTSASDEVAESAEDTEEAEAVAEPKEETTSASGEESAEVQNTEATDSGSALPDTYPLICEDGSITLSFFQELIPLFTNIEDYNDLYWWQELSERTGITFEWYMASFAAAEEQYNLLIASGDLTNIASTSYYDDGISSAVEDEIFVDLSNYLADYAPDYLEVISQDDVYPIVTDDNGSIIAFYEIGREVFPPNSGIIVRGDLLEEQGLDLPVTYDEYEETLLALKTAYNLEAPVYFEAGDNYSLWLSSGKYVQEDFSLDADGNCIYGPLEENFREYLIIANRWYEEGLLYQDFYSVSSTERETVMLGAMSSGDSILTFQYCDFAGNIELGEGEYLVAGYMPRDNADDQLHLTDGIDNKVSSSGYAISTNSTEEEIQAACMLLNYMYTEEGSLFAVFGVEGVSFEYQEDGTPWYTELITNNPDGLTQTAAQITYTGYSVPSWADYSKYNISALTTWADFVEVWGCDDNAWDMPQVSLTAEEQEEYASLSTDVETYLDEALIKFIIGDMDINDDTVWEEYLETMISLGADRMLEIYSDALDRYNSRLK